MEGKKSINTDIVTPAGKYHIQTEFYKTSNKIITLIFTEGRTVARLEHCPLTENIDKEVTDIHNKIFRKLSLLKVSVSENRLVDILTLKTGLRKVFFLEELFDVHVDDVIFKNFGILASTGVNIPEGIAFLKDASLAEIEKGVELLIKRIKDVRGFVLKTSSDTNEITLFSVSGDDLVEKIVELRESSSSHVMVFGMINSKVSGTAFSSDPISKEKSVIIESGWGIWGYLKGAKLNLDRFRVDKEGLNFWRIKKQIANKISEISIELKTGNMVENALSDDRAYYPSLTDSEILSVAKKVLLIEEAFERIVKISFVVDEDGDICFLSVFPVTVKEKKEFFRNLTVEENFHYSPTGIKLLAEVKDVDMAKSINFVPADGLYISIAGISDSVMETILLEKAERFFPQPVIVDLLDESFLKVVSKIRKSGFLNVWVADRGENTVSPDIPYFKMTEIPTVKGNIFTGIYGKLFVSEDSLLAVNIPFVRELLRSGFDFIAVNPDELFSLRNLLLSEEKKLLIDMARKTLDLPERL